MLLCHAFISIQEKHNLMWKKHKFPSNQVRLSTQTYSTKWFSRNICPVHYIAMQTVQCRQKSTHWISPTWYSAAIHKCKLTVRITATFPYRAPWRGGVYQLQMKMFYLDLFMKCMWDSFDKYIWEISLKNIFDKYIWQQVIFILWVCPTRHYLPGWQKEHNHWNGGYCQRRAFNADERSPSLRCFIFPNQFRNIPAVWV